MRLVASAFDANDAGGGTHQTCGDLEQRRLAAAGRSDEDRNLAGAERQIHALNDRTSFVWHGSGAEASDVGELLQRRARCHGVRARSATAW